MNYTEALNYIHSIPKFRRPLGNENLEKLLFSLGDPHKRLKYVHIAGTNGKGSTAALIESILRAAGYKTGLYTSPYIETFNERIRVNGENIPDDSLALYASRVRRAMENADAPVSEFAFVTALAFLYFDELDCDAVVLEAGMGGRLDATNVIEDSLVSVICSIGLDHTRYLGDTAEDIAFEKCGIIREGSAVVSYPNDAAAQSVIRRAANEKKARLIVADKARAAENGFIYKGKTYPLSLRGAYQPQNAASALEAVNVLRARGFDISDEAVQNGLQNARWAARFEFLSEDLVIDGGHNPDGVKVLLGSLLALKRPFVLVTAMMEDKDYESCARIIAPYARAVWTTELDMPRCLSAERLADAVRKVNPRVTVNKNAVSAVADALKAADGALTCVYGSLYLAGEIRRHFKRGGE